MVTVQNLSKAFEGVQALENIGVSVSGGELFGFIGPDGAGKTTLFRILTTLLLPDSGSASLFELDVVRDFLKLRRMIGYMPGRFSLYQDLTVRENLQFFASVFGGTIQSNYHLIKDIYVHLEPFENRLAGKLSGGMKQKLALCCALIHAPRLLVLDEPTTGVDAVSRTEFWQMLKNLQKQGITILVSTPYMDEAGRCDRIALIQNGILLSIDTPSGILKTHDKPLWSVRASDRYALIQTLRTFTKIDSVNAFGDAIHITTRDNKLNAADLTADLSRKIKGEIFIEPVRPTIEDCFLRLMQKE
jgi:ABC-2 type transport system ATP-binding protein